MFSVNLPRETEAKCERQAEREERQSLREKGGEMTLPVILTGK
jgi:hypothetical protein